MTARPRHLVRVLSFALAIAAMAFVAWAVPVRDRCYDARAPTTTRVAVSRDGAGCVLHLRTGDLRIDGAECSRLRCEPGVASTFARARIGVVLGLLALYALGTIAWAARWRALLEFAGIDLSLGHVWRISLESQAGGILMPGGIGGDAFRIASVAARPTRAGEERSPLVMVVASVLLDRAIGLSVIAALASALGFAFGGLGAGPLAVVLAAIPVGFVGGVAVLRRAPLERIRWLVRGRVGAFVTPVLSYVRDARAPRAIAVAAALSVVVAVVQLATIRGLVFALGGAPTAEKWVYVGTAMTFVISVVPALPGGWGTADAAYVFFFGLAGLSAGTALAVCLLYRLFWYLSGAAGAVLHIAFPRRSPPAPSTSPAAEPPA